MRARVSIPLKSPASTGVKSLNFKAFHIKKENTRFFVLTKTGHTRNFLLSLYLSDMDMRSMTL